MKKYCVIQHPKKGKIKFSLYDYQEKMLGEFTDNRYNIILKSRQLGISTLSAGYALWTMIFHNDKNILVIATGKDVAKNLVTKVRVMFEGLPSWPVYHTCPFLCSILICVPDAGAVLKVTAVVDPSTE